MILFHPREAVNAFTHLLGALLSAVGLYLLIKHIPAGSSVRYYVSLYIFGISLILLYCTSGFYHLLNASKRALAFLRRMDHMMIYVLIAGTYTPVCLLVLNGAWRWAMLISVWSLALLGIIFKLAWFKAPRWLSTASYVLMGWTAAIAFYPLSKALSVAGMICLVLGGVFYSTGAVIYATKRPRINLRWLGFHEIFHLFVLAGSLTHFWMVYGLLSVH
ncbi:MAG TPA: hemolysin III family protein [Syntrophomonadaceae bacterium]|nr:hemolysin III family protein [Syntrophomonadaceae bacterium]